MLDEKQVFSGLLVLLSFFVGYKYGCKVTTGDKTSKDETETKNGSIMTFSDFGGDYKMVLVVRNDLKMGKGKIAAQCGHAAVGAYERGLRTMPGIIRRWSNSGQTKVAVRVESEQELKQIRQQAISRNLNVCMIRDAGRTQIEPNTATVVAVGPGLVREVDQVTGHLKLL